MTGNDELKGIITIATLVVRCVGTPPPPPEGHDPLGNVRTRARPQEPIGGLSRYETRGVMDTMEQNMSAACRSSG